jgi:hypothetical protein
VGESDIPDGGDDDDDDDDDDPTNELELGRFNDISIRLFFKANLASSRVFSDDDTLVAEKRIVCLLSAVDPNCFIISFTSRSNPCSRIRSASSNTRI